MDAINFYIKYTELKLVLSDTLIRYAALLSNHNTSIIKEEELKHLISQNRQLQELHLKSAGKISALLNENHGLSDSLVNYKALIKTSDATIIKLQSKIDSYFESKKVLLKIIKELEHKLQNKQISFQKPVVPLGMEGFREFPDVLRAEEDTDQNLDYEPSEWN